MNLLEIRINAIEFVNDNSVHLRFNGSDVERQINISGYVSISIEEYATNAQLSQLRELIRQKVIERLEMAEGGNNE
ncbi:hypothetical protein P4641_08610 [Halalkalibacterium halodurans]|uniref:hypothetical protein n=1 Tax=Halalkalibacterium halodurans TaxID=86665 RepID=UPI002E24526A|nr:hypothetical protein [Halalkalibacterium halodurans]